MPAGKEGWRPSSASSPAIPTTTARSGSGAGSAPTRNTARPAPRRAGKSRASAPKSSSPKGGKKRRRRVVELVGGDPVRYPPYKEDCRVCPHAKGPAIRGNGPLDAEAIVVLSFPDAESAALEEAAVLPGV